MPKYNVRFVETYEDVFEVEANSPEEAVQLFREGIDDGTFDISKTEMTSSDIYVERNDA